MGIDIIGALGDGLRAGIGPVAAVYALAAIGLNVHYGYTGLLNFGQVGFMLVGAYGLGISVSIYGLSLWTGLIIAVLASTALAIVLGIPTLRLRADYLAICTIATAEVLRYLTRSGRSQNFTGGAFGIPSQVGGSGFHQRFYEINPIPVGTYDFGFATFDHRRLWAMAVGWGLVVLASVVVWLLMRSPWGRVIASIREDEDAARALGKNVFAYKMQSLILGGVLGGLAGVVFVLTNAAMTPDQFRPDLTFFTYVALLLGGAGTVLGPVLGAILFQILLLSTTSVLRQVDGLPAGSVGALTLVLTGALLMLLMAFRPQGILGNKREMMLDA